MSKKENQPEGLEPVLPNPSDAKRAQIWERYGFDQANFEEEYVRLDKLVDDNWTAFDHYSEQSPGFTAFVASRPREFRGVFDGYLELTRLQRSLRDEAVTIPDDDDPKHAKRGSDVGLMEFGTRILIYQQIERLRQFGHAGHLPDSFFHYFDGQEFRYSGILTVRFGNIELKDFLSGKKMAAKDLFRFLMIPWIISDNQTPDFDSPVIFKETLAQTNKYPRAQLPNMNLNEVVYASELMIATLDVAQIDVPPYTNLSSKEKQSYEAAVKWIRTITEARDKLYDILINPNATEYKELMDVVSEYALNTSAVVWIAQVFHLFDSSGFTARYRKLRELTSGDIDPEIYQYLANLIEKYIIVGNRENWPLPLSELITLFSDTALKDFPESDSDEETDGTENKRKTINDAFKDKVLRYDWESLRDLARTLNLTCQRARIKTLTFEVDPTSSGLTWEPLNRPYKICITLDQYNPQTKWIISLQWEDPELAEFYTIELGFIAKPKKEEFNWSFLDSPDSPLAKPVTAAFMNLSGDILACLNGKLLEQEKVALLLAKSQTLKPASAPCKKQEKIHYRDKSYELRREARRANREPSFNPFSGVSARETQTLQRFPIVLKGIDINGLLSDVPAEVKPRIIRAIENHNNLGTGTLKKMDYTFPGENIFSLRAGRKWRVLLRLFQGENGGVLIPFAVKHRTMLLKRGV